MTIQPTPQGRCSNHHEVAAVFECVPCRRYMCQACVQIAKLPNTMIEQCPHCGSLAQRLGPLRQSRVETVVRQTQGYGPLISRLGDTPAFLAKPVLLMVLFGLAVFQALIAGAGLPGSMLSIGVQAWVYFAIVEQTANGREDFAAPEFDHIVDDVFLPMFRYLVALLPIIIGVISFLLDASKNMRTGVGAFAAKPTIVLHYMRPLAIILAGLALWPLLTVIAAISKSVFEMLNPGVWLSTLRNMGSDYLVGVIGFYVVLGLELFVWQPMLIRAAMSVQVPFVTTVGFLFLSHIPMALRARILGTMAAPYV